MKKFNIYSITLVLLSTLLSTVFSTKAVALNVQNKKAYLPYSRTYTVIESMPKPERTFTFGLGLDYAYRPFEFGDANTNNRTGSIVDHLFTLDMGVSYSFTDRFALAVGIPLHMTDGIISSINLNQNTKFNLGDISLAGLINIIKRQPFGLSIMPFVTFPTGSENRFVSDSSITGGAIVVADWLIAEEHYLGFNVGMKFRDNETNFGLPVGHELTYAVGYEHYLWPSKNLNGFVEFTGSVSLNNTQQTNSPFEIRYGINKTFLPEKNLKLTVANGVGLGHGYGAPDYRAAVSLSYDLFVKKAEKKPELRIERIEKLLQELTIYYPTDGSQVDPFYDQKIASIANILKSNSDLAPIYILGHTDDVGSDAYNERLSKLRASQAYHSILKHGVDKSQIVLGAFGETYPVVPNTSAENRALNRRTLFTFVKPSYLGGTGQERLPSSDSYTERLKDREGYQNTGKIPGKRRTQQGNVIIEEEVKIQKLYDPKSEYRKRSGDSSFIKSRKNDSFTNYLKENQSSQSTTTVIVSPPDPQDGMVVEQIIEKKKRKRIGGRGH